MRIHEIAITKEEVLDRLNCNKVELAELLGITKQAVQKWPDGEVVPELQAYRLAFVLAPEVFGDLQPEPQEL